MWNIIYNKSLYQVHPSSDNNNNNFRGVALLLMIVRYNIPVPNRFYRQKFMPERFSCNYTSITTYQVQ